MKRRADKDKEELPQEEEEEEQVIHIYGHAQHNHPITSEEERSRSLKTDLMPPANPPKTYCTPDKLGWKFIQTFPDYDKMNTFRREYQCKIEKAKCRIEKWSRIRFCCRIKRSHRHNCNFMLLAMKTTKQGYHVYKHGEHKHDNNNDLAGGSHADKNQQVIDNEEDEDKEESSDDEDEDEAEKPPREITKNVWGQQKQYYFLKTVKTIGELYKFGFKNNCRFVDGKPLHILKSCTMPCTKKKTGKTCDFELLALPPANIHAYANSQHSNHPSMSGTKKKPKMDNGQQNLVQHGEMEEEERGEHEEDKVENEVKEEEDDELLEQEGDTGDEEEEAEQMEVVLDEEVKQEEEEVKIEIIEEENPPANPREETLEERLAKANNKVYNWMAGIEQNAIGPTIEDWDKVTLLKFVEMADQEIREHPEKLNVWLPWLKCLVPKCLPQIEGFNVRFKDLIKLTFN